jgi:hypothetical protein
MAMSEAVHRDQGLWIAPAAPGFDARAIGGETTVDREDGRTLRREWSAAVASSPDAVGVISWNEFSENTYVEPSEKYGHRYLDVLAGIRHAPGPSGELDSSDVSADHSGARSLTLVAAAALLSMIALFVASGYVLVRRQRGTRVERA